MVALMRKQTLSWILFALLAIAGCAEHDDSKGISNPERILTRGIGGDPETLDPGLAEDVHAFSVLIDTFEGLISENAAGELIPGVAERWDVSDDAKVYTFYLRDDARWSNGDPVVALDFVRAIRRVLDPETLSPYGSLLDGVEDLEASSERVLQIRLKSPASHFLALLALPVASPQHESLDASIGNGAYVLVDRIPGSRIQVRKNKHYRDADAVYYDIVNYLPVVDPDAEFNMFRAGELDVTHNIPDAQIAGMLRDNLAEAHISASLSLYYLAFDMTGPPLDDPALRQALSMAIDRQAIVEMLGRGDRAAYGVVPPGISGYDGAQYSWHTQPAEERQATARNLFAAAGYDGVSIGRVLSFTLSAGRWTAKPMADHFYIIWRATRSPSASSSDSITAIRICRPTRNFSASKRIQKSARSSRTGGEFPMVHARSRKADFNRFRNCRFREDY